MNRTIIDSEKDPLGMMLSDYLAGDKNACVRVDSPQLEMSRMKGSVMFRPKEKMSALEQCALDLCQGHILDVGAGSGCHSLVLQEAGKDVTALDISPGCMAVMEKQGVTQRIFASLFSLKKERFNTLLMLMNGIGICGSIEGLNYFLQQMRTLLHPGGQIIADSTDLTSMYTRQPLAATETDAYYGETQFTMTYGKVRSDPFDWLYIDYATLAFYAEFHGWRCEKIMTGGDGKYLFRIF